MECKVESSNKKKLLKVVLIETLWNVKINGEYFLDDSEDVLIETLWNVKETTVTCFLSEVHSINRNIVECKVHRRFFLMLYSPVLIETLWNVKMLSAEALHKR